MKSEVGAKIVYGDNYKAVEMPYGRTNFTMVVIVPEETLGSFYSSLTSQLWTSVTSGLDDTDEFGKLIVGMPKFKFSYEKYLNQQLQAMGPKAAAALRAQVLHQARDHFQYLYQHFNINGGRSTDNPPALAIYDLLEFMLGEEFLGFARRLTGTPELDDLYAHATLYTAGSFLKIHEDVTPAQDRRYAYVLGLTRGWRADMGGLLHFLDDEGNVVETVVPRYNSLTIFRVPMPHLVSMVAPWVQEPRLAVTGWLLVRR